MIDDGGDDNVILSLSTKMGGDIDEDVFQERVDKLTEDLVPVVPREVEVPAQTIMLDEPDQAEKKVMKEKEIEVVKEGVKKEDGVEKDDGRKGGEMVEVVMVDEEDEDEKLDDENKEEEVEKDEVVTKRNEGLNANVESLTAERDDQRREVKKLEEDYEKRMSDKCRMRVSEMVESMGEERRKWRDMESEVERLGSENATLTSSTERMGIARSCDILKEVGQSTDLIKNATLDPNVKFVRAPLPSSIELELLHGKRMVK
ncbi:hypothetical protein Dimus_020088 [Dionaea muscipula]